MLEVAIVGLGGALGSMGRYLLGLALLRWLGPALPYGTFAANVLGSFLIGLVMELAARSGNLSPRLVLALTTGLFGGFTTFSALTFETLRLAESRLGWSVLYLTSTLAGGLLACAAGFAAGGALARFSGLAR